MSAWPWQCIFLSLSSGALGVGLLLAGGRRQQFAAVVIFGAVGAALCGWLFDSAGLQPVAGVVAGAVLGALAGAHLHPALSALAAGLAAAVLLSGFYWVLWVRQPLSLDAVAEAGSSQGLHALLADQPVHAALICILAAVGMLAGLVVGLRRQRITAIVLASLAGGFALTLSGLLLAGRPARVGTLVSLLRPGWLWCAALPLAAAGTFVQLRLQRPAEPRATAARPAAKSPTRRGGTRHVRTATRSTR
jgi:hypothetical protein